MFNRWKGSVLPGALLACAGLTGCIAYDDFPCDGSFRIEATDLSVEQRAAIVRAGDRWNELIGREHFTIGVRGTCPVRVGETPLEPGEVASLAAYQWKDGDAWITLSPALLDASIERFEGVVLHELGHSEGLEDVPGYAVMGEDADHAPDFTDLDRSECRRVGLCS